MASETTVPNLTLSQDARLYKYVRLSSGWKYLRADYSDSFGVKPHSVFLPKTNTPTIVEGGKYVASDGGKWLTLSPDPNEAWTLFKLYRNEGRMSRLEEKSQQLRQQLATGQKAVVNEEKPKVLTVGDAIANFLKSFRLKILSGGRKPRTYDAIEDILVAFKAAIGAGTPLAALTRESAINHIATLKRRTGGDPNSPGIVRAFFWIAKELGDRAVKIETLLEERELVRPAQNITTTINDTSHREEVKSVLRQVQVELALQMRRSLRIFDAVRSSRFADADLNIPVRRLHDFYGWMAKHDDVRGCCAGALYRTAGFMAIPPNNRVGRKLGQNIHIEHTVPIAVLLKALRACSSNFESLCKMHQFLINHSVCTAFTVEERNWLGEAKIPPNKNEAFNDDGGQLHEYPFRRYLPLIEQGRDFRVINVVTGKEVDLKSFSFSDHAATLAEASRMVTGLDDASLYSI